MLAFQIIHYNAVGFTKKGLPSVAVVEKVMGVLITLTTLTCLWDETFIVSEINQRVWRLGQRAAVAAVIAKVTFLTTAVMFHDDNEARTTKKDPLIPILTEHLPVWVQIVVFKISRSHPPCALRCP